MSSESIFIGCEPEDVGLCEQLATSLRREGYLVRYRQANKNEKEIQSILQHSSVFIALLPTNLGAFPQLEGDMITFQEYMRQDNTRRFLTVRLGKQEVPLLLRGYTWLEADQSTFAEVITEIKRSLKIPLLSIPNPFLTRHTFIRWGAEALVVGGVITWWARLYPSGLAESAQTTSMPIVTGTGSADLTPEPSNTPMITNQPLSTFTSIGADIFSVGWSPDNKKLAAINGGTLFIWDATTGTILSQSSDFDPPVYTSTDQESFSGSVVAWSPDGGQLAVAGGRYVYHNGQITATHYIIHIIDISAKRSILAYQGHNAFIQQLAWLPDGHRIASSGYDSAVQVWDSVTGIPSQVYRGQSPRIKNGISSLAIAPDNIHAACTIRENYEGLVVNIWDMRTAETVFKRSGGWFQTGTLGWSPDGRWIAAPSADDSSKIEIWESTTGNLRLQYQGGQVGTLDWSPDSTRIASSDGNDVRVWDAATGQTLRLFKGHFDSVLTVKWSPDGTRIVSAGTDQTAQVWIP